jgi:hypothetical protein
MNYPTLVLVGKEKPLRLPVNWFKKNLSISISQMAMTSMDGEDGSSHSEDVAHSDM